eukprot:206332_1
MADFKRKRKQYRHQKINDNNNNSDESSNKRAKRRGVSVFQRQLRKRKVWVDQYEANKDQKHRDKRKVMRGYYRALKELDREHQQIFGNSISTRTRRRAKKTGDYSKVYGNKNDTFKPRDVWHELKKQSNWSFIDNKKYKKYKSNKSYHGNGIINLGNKGIINRNEMDKYRNINRNINNKNVSKNEYLSEYDKAMMEGKKIIDNKKEIEYQKELKQKQRKKALNKFEMERKRRKKILNMKNRKGQPNLNAQIGLLLDKIKKSKQNKQINKSGNHSDIEIEVNNFLQE